LVELKLFSSSTI